MFHNSKIVLFYLKILLTEFPKYVHNKDIKSRHAAQWQVRKAKRTKTENAYSQIKERKRNGKNEKSAGQVL